MPRFSVFGLVTIITRVVFQKYRLSAQDKRNFRTPDFSEHSKPLSLKLRSSMFELLHRPENYKHYVCKFDAK